MPVGPDNSTAPAAAAPRRLLLAFVCAALGALLCFALVAPEADAGRKGKAKRTTKEKLVSDGEQPVKFRCRMRGKPHKPGGRFAFCKWRSAKPGPGTTTRSCRGQSELRRGGKFRFKRRGCRLDRGASKVNLFMPDPLAKQGFESTQVFCYSTLNRGFRCSWEALQFKRAVIEDCFGAATNFNKRVSITLRGCRVNAEATAAQRNVRQRLAAEGLAPGQIDCRPGGSIQCEYEATTRSAGWTYRCEGEALTGATLSSAVELQPCDLEAPDKAPLGPSSGPRPSFGINAPWTTMAGQLSQLRGIGGDTARYAINWATVESTRGEYDWGGADAAYQEALRLGIRPVLIITGSPCWAHGPNCGSGFITPAKDQHLDEWADFAGDVAERFPEALAIEVWNEANTRKFFLGGSQPAAYAKLLRAAYDGIKAANPAMTVLTTGTAAHVKNQNGKQRYDEFLRAIYQHGAKQYSDAIAHHGYSGAGPNGDYVGGVRGQLADLKDVMLDFGDQDKDIWITETGVSNTAGGGSADDAKAYTESQQAKALSDLYAMYRRVPGVPTVIFHRWQDDPPGNGPESGFGLKRFNGSLKPAFCALAAAAGSPC